MLEIKGLVKRYGETLALDHLDLEVKEGEIFGLLGPNGSGKTTTIGCILALLKYDRGEIRLFGKEMSPTAYDSKRQIGVVFQDVAVFDRLSVFENIDYFCGLYVPDRAERRPLVEEALSSTGLNEYRKKRPKQLSGGLLRRLNIACGIVHKPKLIILDEPTVAVDPQSRNRILEDIKALNKAGSTIIYTSHYMEEVEQICTRIAIIDHGRQVACGTSQELKEMIRTGESVTVEGVVLTQAQIDEIRRMPQIYDLSYENEELKLKYENSTGHLLPLLHYLEQEGIAFANVFSEQPTLNDVFLEITGKELRD
ncbi:MAG: ABC transporter ATP-binding protein [Lachnospiraceae bacterium]|nr:ABC transporter ATP-binding protein [Lachnospiraceae bacterium]